MPGKNLTKIEAQTRQNVIGKVAYTVQVELSENGETFPSRTVIDFEAEVGRKHFRGFNCP
mgnify:CR=1 FL=1